MSQTNFSSLENDLKLNIQINKGDSSSDLIRYLNGKATINHFVELIPSANDIFIETVHKNSKSKIAEIG